MLTYNLQDIVATRDLHKRFMGWSKNTPNIATITKQVQGVTLKKILSYYVPTVAVMMFLK